jgi:acetyltransferase-like isoleucine patch superfamily enzyme
MQMGNYCSIAPSVQIGGTEHAWWWGSTSLRLSDHHVSSNITIIGDDVWIGANAIIRQGVRICRGAVIGAYAMVMDDVPPYTIVAGIPAKPMKRRFPDTIVEKIAETNFWLYPPRIARKLLEEIDYPLPYHSRTFLLKRIK